MRMPHPLAFSLSDRLAAIPQRPALPAFAYAAPFDRYFRAMRRRCAEFINKIRHQSRPP
jgi:hypothetical protein